MIRPGTHGTHQFLTSPVISPIPDIAIIGTDIPNVKNEGVFNPLQAVHCHLDTLETEMGCT
jgi:hypothetical protein